MGTTTKLTFDEYQMLPEEEGSHYELNEGNLVMLPSPTFWHNRIRDQVARRLTEFVKAHRLGEVTVQTDFRLSEDTVCAPDVAVVTAEHLKQIDIYHWPVAGAPALAVEIISPSNLAQDTAKKVRQYLAAGSQAVWVIYPVLRLVEMHDAAGSRDICEPHSISEDKLFPGLTFTLSLAAIFDDEFQAP